MVKLARARSRARARDLQSADMSAASASRGTTTTEGFMVRVRDDIDARLAGHAAVSYLSPPQPLEDALRLITLLAGIQPAGELPRRRTLAIAGGRRTIELIPA